MSMSSLSIVDVGVDVGIVADECCVDLSIVDVYVQWDV